MWSEGNPRTEIGMQSWVVAARQHSVALQEIRGTGPLVSGLMGMDMCAGCCRMDIRERLSAEQVANRPFHHQLSEMERRDGHDKRSCTVVAPRDTR